MRTIAGLPLLASITVVFAGCSSGPTENTVSDDSVPVNSDGANATDLE